MIRKILTGVLALVLIMSISEAAYGASISTDGGSAAVPVTYTVDNSSFEITVPALITPSTEEESFLIGASNMNIRPDQYVEVRVISGCDQNGTVTMERQNVPVGKQTATLETTFSVAGKNISETDYVVGHFEDGSSIVNTAGAVTMSAVTVDETTQAGDYLATVEFRVDLKSK